MISWQTAHLAPVAGQSVPWTLNACHALPLRHAANSPVLLDLMIPLWITRNHFLCGTRITVCWKIVTLVLLLVQSHEGQDPSHPPGGRDQLHHPDLGRLVCFHYQVCTVCVVPFLYVLWNSIDSIIVEISKKKTEQWNILIPLSREECNGKYFTFNIYYLFCCFLHLTMVPTWQQNCCFIFPLIFPNLIITVITFGNYKGLYF